MAKMTTVGGDEKKKGIGIGWIMAIVAFLVVVSVGPKILKQVISKAPAAADASMSMDTKEAVRFATKVCISINNVGFHNISTYLDDNSSYFTPDVMNDFQSHFFTVELQHMIQDYQLFAFAQNIHTTEVKAQDGWVSVWFVGDTMFTSKISNTSIKIPMSFKLQVEKINGSYKVIGFKTVTSEG